MRSVTFEFDPANREFVRRPVTIPELGDAQVLVKVTCCTICGSDVHTYTGRRDLKSPCVLGHEIIGTIAAWHGDATPVDFFGKAIEVGQRVTWAMAVGCGECFFCKNGLSQKCESLFKYGHHTASDNLPRGGISEYCVLVKNTPIFPIDAALSDEAACPANCATATVMAALRLASDSHEIEAANVLVLGAGLLGLTATAAASEKRARTVAVADIDPCRLALAKTFGADHCFDPAAEQETNHVINTLTNGRGFDIVFDFAGALASIENAIRCSRVGGCIVLVGSVFPTDPLVLSPESIVRRMLTIRGLHNYAAQDLADGLRFLAAVHEKYPFANLVSESFPLDDVEQAFKAASAASANPIRVAVRSSFADDKTA